MLASVPLTTAEMESMKGNSRLRFVEVLNMYEQEGDPKIVTFLNSSYLPFWEVREKIMRVVRCFSDNVSERV